MDAATAQLAMRFLGRTQCQLNGAEVPAFNQVMNALLAIAQGPSKSASEGERDATE